MNRFQDQVAVVTGAGVGIGRDIAARLVAEGASVVLNDLDPGLAESAAAAIDGPVVAMGGDVGDVDATRALVDRAIGEFGRLDLAVANAGITLYGDFFDYEPAAFDKVLQVNLRGSFFLAQAAARHMRARGGGGRVLFMSSVTGHQAIRYLAAYGMTKAALEMLAKALVVELAPHGITVNTVAPGATVVDRNLADDPDYIANWSRVTPTGRPATVADIAEACLYFLSPAAGHVTGQSLVVDGGWTSYTQTPDLDFVD